MEEEDTMIKEREELMVSPMGGTKTPILRKAYFLKPILSSPTNQPLPKPPSFSLPSNPNINNLTKRVLFKGRPKPQSTWKAWVDDLQQTHQEIWKKVGIFDALRASTYNIKRDNELIISLAEKWCSETNTFIFPWGESTITLEDIMILGGFSVLGVSVLSPSQTRDFEEEIEVKLVIASSEIRKSCNLVTQNGWMNYFKGMGGELEHVAFLVLWLSRYVFCTNSYNIIAPNVFVIGISLARGTKIALAPAILASIYRDLTLLKETIVASISKGGDDDDGADKLGLCAPFQLVQLWAWERFWFLSPEPKLLERGEPRLARWHNKRKLKVGNLRLYIESAGGRFLWRPYASYLKNWVSPKFYCDGEMWVVLKNSDIDQELLSFARCLRPCELVGVDCMEQYLPHRVGMQFGMDQDIPDSFPRSNHDLELAWRSYDKPLEGLNLYFPPRYLNGDVTLEYSNWWRKTPVCSSPPCSKGIPSVNSFYVVNEITPISVMPPVIVVEDIDKPEHNATKEDRENEVNESCMMTDGWSEHSSGVHTENGLSMADHKAQSGKEPQIDPNTKNLFLVVAENVQGEAAEDANMKEVNSSLDDVVEIEAAEEKTYQELSGTLGSEFKDIISKPVDNVHGIAEEDIYMKLVNNPHDEVVVIDDDEEENNTSSVEELGSELQARISRLERVVSMLRAAK